MIRERMPQLPMCPEQDPNEETQRGFFRCPNGHEWPIAMHISGVSEDIDGVYCQICWVQHMISHSPRVELVKIED